MEVAQLVERRHLGRFVATTLILGFGACAAVLHMGCSSLGTRIALPGLLQGDPRAILPANPSYEIITLRTKDGTRIVGQFGKAMDMAGQPVGDSEHAPTVLCFYGSAQHLSAPSDQKLFRDLRAAGVNVFIPEYAGFGMSEGKPSEAQCYATADAALDYLLNRPDIDHRRIIVAGRSLGTGPAFDLASRRQVAGLISVGGFTTMADAAAASISWMPHWLAKSLLADCRFDNLSKIKSVSCPILLVYGMQDTVVPPWMAERLASEAKAPVAKLPVPCSHNSLWKSPATGLNATVHVWMHARQTPQMIP